MPVWRAMLGTALEVAGNMLAMAAALKKSSDFVSERKVESAGMSMAFFLPQDGYDAES